MTIVLPRVEGPHAGLIDWLTQNHVEHEVHLHPLAFTAEAAARAAHEEPGRFAKGVAVGTDDGRHVLLLVDAGHHVDLAKARRALHATDVRILPEAEVVALAPDCDPGTLPPVPAVFGVPVVADLGFRDREEVSFAAGSHRYSVTVGRRSFERASPLTYADIAHDSHEPAWDS